MGAQEPTGPRFAGFGLLCARAPIGFDLPHMASGPLTIAADTPSPPDAGAPRRSELRERIESLCESAVDGREGPSRNRASVEAELSELRSIWRRNPSLFDPDTIVMLSHLASSLRGSPATPPPTAPPPAAASAPPRSSAPDEVLRDIFGYASFRPGQRELIDAVLAGRDAVGVMPTGSGKSITFQIPARILGGITLVISPLIALMKDQVDAVTEAGLRATCLNSSLSYEQKKARIERVRRGEIELLYAAPEGLQASVGAALQGTRLSLLAVDEAHCISMWGHDFRPAYRELAGMKQRFGGAPVLALTATATPQVARDIVSQLGMRDPTLVRTSFFRPNLRLAAHPKRGDGSRDRSTNDDVLSVVRSHAGESGIVYCLSRKATETTARHLREHGCRARAYHAGMDAKEREQVQDAFCRDDVDVIVATIAFGMGIDKSNVRFVVHRDLPRSIEGYYQEIGRAGRDGLPSDCVLFYSWSEVAIYERFAADSSDPNAEARVVAQARQMYRMAEGGGCRHQVIATHFGERIAPCTTSCDACCPEALFASKPKARSLVDRGRPQRPIRAAPRAQEPAQAARPPRSGEQAAVHDSALFEQLRILRRALADERGVPAFIILSDATLLAMATTRPLTPEDFLKVPGIGPRKLAAYGDAFLQVLRRQQPT